MTAFRKWRWATFYLMAAAAVAVPAVFAFLFALIDLALSVAFFILLAILPLLVMAVFLLAQLEAAGGASAANSDDLDILLNRKRAAICLRRPTTAGTLRRRSAIFRERRSRSRTGKCSIT